MKGRDACAHAQNTAREGQSCIALLEANSAAVLRGGAGLQSGNQETGLT